MTNSLCLLTIIRRSNSRRSGSKKLGKKQPYLSDDEEKNSKKGKRNSRKSTSRKSDDGGNLNKKTNAKPIEGKRQSKLNQDDASVKSHPVKRFNGDD